MGYVLYGIKACDAPANSKNHFQINTLSMRTARRNGVLFKVSRNNKINNLR